MRLTQLRKALAEPGSNVEIVAIGNHGFEIRTLDMPRGQDAAPGSAQVGAVLAGL